MVIKEMIQVGKQDDILIYKVPCQDADGETYLAKGISDATFDRLLPNGYDTDKEEYAEEYAFDEDIDFYLPNDISYAPNEKIIEYLNEHYGDEEHNYL